MLRASQIPGHRFHGARIDIRRMLESNCAARLHTMNALSDRSPRDCGHQKVRCRTKHFRLLQRKGFGGSERTKAYLAERSTLRSFAMEMDFQPMPSVSIRLTTCNWANAASPASSATT